MICTIRFCLSFRRARLAAGAGPAAGGTHVSRIACAAAGFVVVRPVAPRCPAYGCSGGGGGGQEVAGGADEQGSLARWASG